MSQDAERVADKFATRQSANGSRVSHGNAWVDRTPHTRDSVYRIFTDGQTIWSYGTHFPIARHVSSDTVHVTTERYQTGQWKSGKPKFGPTTDNHIRETRYALARNGYVCIDETEHDDWHERWQYHPTIVEVWRKLP